ncbi:uncharacterized protein LOC106652087 isoform X1 [Trichogramma pretiosum]|uniref:uncharacterized protein LOC106652087 isoform X1 n=1 Tax=Trichogramma pretiosum TaxID=7493 RepID=UPI0006C96F66|nr:uncharacterized protein LOC106652087 isoform X1 [Trichogramma pretiosum]
MDTDFTRAPRMIDLSLITTLVIIFACAPSQMLKNASDDLFLTSCELNYQNYPPKIRKMFLFVIIRVEKSFALTAGPQVELNFETCSIIIKTSFSYAAAFRSVYTSHNN